jgi:hypothetical protein
MQVYDSMHAYQQNYITSVLTITKLLLSTSISLEAENFGFKTKNERSLLLNKHGNIRSFKLNNAMQYSIRAWFHEVTKFAMRGLETFLNILCFQSRSWYTYFCTNCTTTCGLISSLAFHYKTCSPSQYHVALIWMEYASVCMHVIEWTLIIVFSVPCSRLFFSIGQCHPLDIPIVASI